MDALNIHTIQANLKRLTPMQLQMEAQSQVVPQWLVALEQQRRATLQEGLASMQAPQQQQTTVMEDLAAKTAAPEPMGQQEGIAQYAEGGAVGKKKEEELNSVNRNAESMDEGLASRFIRLDEMSKTSPQAAKSTAEAFLQAGQGRSEYPPEYLQTLEAFVNQPLPEPAQQPEQGIPQALPQPAPVQQAQGIVQTLPQPPADDLSAEEINALTQFQTLPPETRSVAVAAELQKVKGTRPVYERSLNMLLNTTEDFRVPPPAPPKELVQETMADQPTLETLAPHGPADTSPIEPNANMGPAEMDAYLAELAKTQPKRIPKSVLAEREKSLEDMSAPALVSEIQPRAIPEKPLAPLETIESMPIPQTPIPTSPQPEQGIPQALPQPAPVQTAPRKPEIVVPPDVKPYWDLIRQGGDMPKPNLEGYDKKSERKEKQLKYAEDNNLSMALMSASAAILAGESPFTMVNLGKGFAAGLHQYANGRKNINDLQDQIDDVVMARDKAANDQNMREFELQDRRLSVLATIKQRMDEAAAKNATHLEGARIAAGAHIRGAQIGAHNQLAREKGDAMRAVNIAQAQYTDAVEEARKLKDSTPYLIANEEDKLRMNLESKARISQAQQQLEDYKTYARSLNLPLSSSGAPSSGSNSGIRVTGEKKAGAATPTPSPKATAAPPAKATENVPRYLKEQPPIPQWEIEENKRKAGG